MSVLEWKMFNFFKLRPLQINRKYDIIKDTTTYCSNLIYKIFCTVDGSVHIFKEEECITFSMSDNPIKLCSIADESEIFVTVEQYSFTNEIELKIYNLSKLSKRIPPVVISNAAIKCLCNMTTLKTIYSKFNLILAFGLENGNILLYNAPLSRDISSSFKTINVCIKPIKGIEFLHTENGVVKMFTCSDDGVFCYTISNSTNISNIAQTKIILDDKPASIHCWTLKITNEPGEQYFVVGKTDALYCYTFDGRGPCYAIDGFKQIVKWFGKHLIVVLQSNKWLLRNGVHSSQLIIINIVNKMVVLNQELNNSVKCILPTIDLNNCLIVLVDGTILTLQERQLQHKLQLLYNKKLYDIALKLMEDSSSELETLAGAYIRYGDHLLQRGDTSEAVQMYINTIGVVSPFHIINKLMITRHNEYLIQYLSVLVKSDFKSPEHVVLLHNCRRRIELPSKVEQIFQLEETKYDCYIDNSIAVDRQSKIVTFLNIFHDTHQITEYFSFISDNEIISFFSEYGFWLLSHYPTEITKTIKYLFCDRCHNFDYLEKLTRYFMLLLLANKDCSLGIIDKLDAFGSIAVNNIWTDLVIHLWKSGDLDMNFVIEYLKTHSSLLCFNNVFIICRTHQFWPGIRMMYDRCNLEMLSMRCLVKCFEINPSDIKDFVPNAINGPSHLIWLQSLSNETLDGYKSIKFVNLILGHMIFSNPHYILNVLQSILTNNSFHLSHLNELFLHESFLTKFKSHELKNYVASLDERVLELKQLLYDFLNRPIEFRSRSCEICKQSIKQPMVYFLCQHSYHRECISPNINGHLSCISCNTIKSSNSTDNFQEHKQSKYKDQFIIRSCAIQNVSNKLGKGIFITTCSKQIRK